MRTRLVSVLVCLGLIFSTLILQQTSAQRNVARSVAIPTPHDVLGFTPGDDRKLASWNQVLQYFDKLDQASNRVKFEALGKSTMDRPFVMATISAPENLARLDYYKSIQAQLADPRKLGPRPGRDRKAAQLIRRGKTIVLITCGIHSTEVGSTLASMLIAHRLASSNEPQVQEILRNTIVLLVPSLNPDGVDIVKNWYDKTLGTPYEGTSPPELYHKYVGHDNNRDWYAFTQVETQITVSKIHNVWRPQIVHDIHQQGENGSRLFLPPYMQPVEPNVPKQLVEGYTELGNWIAQQMRVQGFKGITTNSTYDAWSPARAYSHYHGGVRILSETASARIATPVKIDFRELRGDEGYDAKKESANFGPVWQGGEWRLRDITNYMTTAAFTLLTHASNNRERWLSRFYEVGNEAVRPRRSGELAGFVIDPTGPGAGQLRAVFDMAGVEYRAVEKGYFINMAQPYGAFAKALLEEQHYPSLRDEKGNPIQPYDVTAHTLSLLYGTKATPVFAPFRLRSAGWGAAADHGGCSYQSSRNAIYKSHVPSMDEGWTRWILNWAKERECIQYASLFDDDVRRGKLREKFDTILIPDQSPGSILNGHRSGAMPSEFTGGLGEKGVKALREFVEEGGTLVTFNRASTFAIEQFKLPVRDVVARLPRTDFFVPGSILRIELDTSHPISRGMTKETIAWVEDSPVFEVKDNDATVRVIARYPANSNPLLSGWLLGEQRLRGKAALLEARMGKGRVVLFGFRPQYRAQSMATFPLMFNSFRLVTD